MKWATHEEDIELFWRASFSNAPIGIKSVRLEIGTILCEQVSSDAFIAF